MKAKNFIAGFVFVVFCLVSLSYSQVPQMINRQGRLTDTIGNVIDTTVSTAFAIHTDTGGTDSLWGEIQDSVRMENPLKESEEDIYIDAQVGGELAGAMTSDDVRTTIPIPGPPLVSVNLCLGGTVTDENGHEGYESADPFGLVRAIDGDLSTSVIKKGDSPRWLEVTFGGRPRWINKIEIVQEGTGHYQVEYKDLWDSWHTVGIHVEAHSPGAVVGYDMFDFEPVKAKAIRWRSTENSPIQCEGYEVYEIEAYFLQVDLDDDGQWEIGVEWVNDYPGEGLDLFGRDDDALDLYNAVGEQPGWVRSFEWGNASAFEEDFKRSGLGGDEDDEIDQVDLAYFCGHGGLDLDPTWGGFLRRSLFFGVAHDDHHLVPGEGGRWADETQSWGDADLEWLGFSACETMIDHRYWANCLNGLHLILGWETLSNDIFPHGIFDPNTLGDVWAREMLAGRTMTQAWFNAADETHPGGRIAAVVAEEMDNFNDHLWGEGYVSPDPEPDPWYHYWTFTVPWIHTAAKEKEETRGEYLSERLNDSSDPLVPFPNPTGKGVPIKYKSPVLSSVQETTMVQYYVIPRSVDSAYIQSIADRLCAVEGVMCCTAPVESDQAGHLWMICGSEELKVSEASGGVQYLNSGWWMVPPTVGPILPEPTQVFTLANGFLTEMMMKPPDSYVWLVSLAHLGWFMKETGKADEDSSMYTSIVAAYRREMTGGYQVTGPGAVLNVTYGDNNRLERWAMGGWRDIYPGPEVSVITAEEAMELVATEGSGATIGGIPLFDTLIVLEAELAYWEESADVVQDQLEIIWALTCLCLTEYDTTETEIYVPARALPPRGSIDAPPDSSWYQQGEAVVFSGSATGGLTPYTFDWYSDVDGYLGSGEIITTNTLSAVVRDGDVIPHTITLKVTDLNGMSDNACISVFIGSMCGDSNGDGQITVDDVVYLINWLFKDGDPPDPFWAGDANSDGDVEIGDVVYLINYLFRSGPAPCAGKEGGFSIEGGKLSNTLGHAKIELLLDTDQNSTGLAKTSTKGFDGLSQLLVVGKFDRDVVGIQLMIEFDPDEVTLLEPSLTSLTRGLQLFSSTKDGRQRIGMVDLSGMNFLSAGEGVLANLQAKGKDLASIRIKEAVLVDKDAMPLNLELDGELRLKESKNTESLPQHFSLSQNYPNPFNPETEISYALPIDCHVKISIYNIAGQKVKTLVDEHQTAGYKTIHWNGKDNEVNEVASGVYFYRIQAGGFTDTKKMILIK